METPERHRRTDEPGGPAAGPQQNEGLERVRRAGADFLSAGDDAIERALSGNSERFLQEVRQTGGQ